MGKSYRRTNIAGNCGTSKTSEKQDKRFANRTLRRSVKQAIYHERDTMPVMREVSNVWSFRKDGKQYFGTYEEFMKKVMNRSFKDEIFWTKVWKQMKRK